MNNIKRIKLLEIILGIIAIFCIGYILENKIKSFDQEPLSYGIILAACIWAIVKIELHLSDQNK